MISHRFLRSCYLVTSIALCSSSMALFSFSMLWYYVFIQCLLATQFLVTDTALILLPYLLMHPLHVLDQQRFCPECLVALHTNKIFFFCVIKLLCRFNACLDINSWSQMLQMFPSFFLSYNALPQLIFVTMLWRFVILTLVLISHVFPHTFFGS